MLRLLQAGLDWSPRLSLLTKVMGQESRNIGGSPAWGFLHRDMPEVLIDNGAVIRQIGFELISHGNRDH